MDSGHELKDKVEVNQYGMVETKGSERSCVMKEVKRLCDEFGFTARVLNGSLAEG